MSLESYQMHKQWNVFGAFVFKPDGLFLLQSIKRKQTCQPVGGNLVKKITPLVFQCNQLTRLTPSCGRQGFLTSPHKICPQVRLREKALRK